MRWEKKRPLSFFIVLTAVMLGVGMMLGLVRPVNAYTNQFVLLTTQSCAGACTNPVTIASTVNTANDILVVAGGCATQFPISTITDTLMNSWGSAGLQQFPISAGSASGSLQGMAVMWFSSPSPSGADTVTVTFTQTNSYCRFVLLEGNTPSIAVFTGHASSESLNLPASSPGPVTTLTNAYQASEVPDNSIVLSLGFTVPNNALNSAAGISPLSSQSVIEAGSASGVGSGEGQIFVASSASQVVADSYSHVTGQTIKDSDVLLSVVFAQQGVLPGKPASNYFIGCSKASFPSTGVKQTGNSTLYYPIWNAVPSTFNSVTVDIKSIALTNGQTDALMGVGVFTSTNSPPQGQGPSNTAPWFLSSFASVTLTNNASPQNITFAVSSSVGPGEASAIGVWVSHNGVTLRAAAAASNTMYFDNSTTFASGGPNKLQQFNPATKNACFGTLAVAAATTQTATFSSVVSTTTVTQSTGTLIVTVTSTQTTLDVAAASATLPGELLLVLLVLGPALALAAVTKSFWGAMFGALIGTAIGAAPPPAGPGMIPFWFLGVVVLGCIMLLFLAPKGGNGGNL